jgi:putative ABC transport system permease protein
VAMLLASLRLSQAAGRLSLNGMALRNSTRRSRRSLATVALLACGSFLIVAVGANRLDANLNANDRSSGTGGFALFGESSLPVLHDLNSAEGRDFFGLNEQDLQGVSVVPMRVRDGDDASCLNLNKAQTPRLLGVRPELLASRKAFSFAKVANGLSLEQGWEILHSEQNDGAVPAIGDANSIQWAMKKKVGDTLDFMDERGNTFKVRLVGAVANSILQGSLLIGETEFIKRFPGESGYRMFLIDAPSNSVKQVTATLGRGLQDVGLELTPAADRLNAFNAVQNTYLNTFQILGGLGLLLGSAGLGVVVLRNVLERRGELALLQAVGLRKQSLHWLVLTEHAALLVLGLLVGMVAALLAVLPALKAPGAQLHVAALVWTLAGVFLSGMLWTWLATRMALRGELLPALRNE